MRAPFYKYIINSIFLNKDIQYICDDLAKKHLIVSAEEVGEVYRELLDTSSDSITEKLKEKEFLDLENENHIDVLKHYGVYEFYTRQNEKWIDDVKWILKYQDVQLLVSIFMFNEDDISMISSVLKFKYGKKIGVDALKMFQSMFWDTSSISAKEAANYFRVLRNSTYILRLLEDGTTEVEYAEFHNQENCNGTSQSFTVMESGYVKWKLGYRDDLKVPSTKTFLESVKTDSMYKYQEALHMTRSVEMAKDEGEGLEGPVNMTHTRRSNTEKDRAKLMKDYLDMFIKADGSMPDEAGEEEANFFKNLKQVSMTFEQEKIASIADNKQMLLDIKDQM
jgi:hypothetical protein